MKVEVDGLTPVPNKPKVSVDVKQHFNNNNNKKVTFDFVFLMIPVTFPRTVRIAHTNTKFASYLDLSLFNSAGPRVNSGRGRPPVVSRDLIGA